MDICERLREARNQAGMTQEQVAESIMVSRVTISHWENGKSLPDIASLINLSDLYHISLDSLVKGDSKMTEKVKRDSRNLQVSTKLILTTGILVAIVGVIYLISMIIGGAFRDFCEGAIKWVLFGIGLATVITYFSQNKPEGKE